MSNYIREKLTNYRKVNWKEVFPPYNKLRAELDFYRSDINLHEFDGKEYIDPEYGYPESFSKINYIVLSGEWEMDSYIEDDKHILKLIDNKSGQTIEFAFSSLSDKISFVNEIYSNKPVKQVNKGMNIESIINSKVKSNQKTWLPIITSMGLVAAYFFSKRKN